MRKNILFEKIDIIIKDNDDDIDNVDNPEEIIYEYNNLL